jgi:hypothetical protein
MDSANATYLLELDGPVIVVAVEGMLDLGDLASFEEVVARVDAHRGACVLSLEAITYCPVRVVGIVIALARRLARARRAFGFVLPRAPSARRTFEIAEAPRHLRAFVTRADAVSAIRSATN